MSSDSVRRLAELHGADHGRSTLVDHTLRIDAQDPVQAARRALDLVQRHGAVVGLEVLTIAEAERRLVSPRLPDLVGALDSQQLARLRAKQRASKSPGSPTSRRQPS